MNFIVGYQMRNDNSFLSAITDNASKISELYFSWNNMPSGRNQVNCQSMLLPFEAAQKQCSDLTKINSAGIQMNLLLNANCYGAKSLSRAFYQEIGDLIQYFSEHFPVHIVTTTSPIIAHFIKENFKDIELRASINMEIGSVNAIKYLMDQFDSFYIKRELNRDMQALTRISSFCHQHGKGVYLLANSGCLNQCPSRQFHDNLVAHEQEIAGYDNAFDFHSTCSQFLQNPAAREDIIRYSNWIRPEDIFHYEGIVDGIKLATRISPVPVEILNAYIKGEYAGNILELTEPNHAHHFHPIVLNNHAFPESFFRNRHYCNQQCESCNYCHMVYKEAAESISPICIDHNSIFEEENQPC